MGDLAEVGMLTRNDALQSIQNTPILEQLYGKCIFLTGGTGFAGSWLLELITTLNEHRGNSPPCLVFVLTRNPSQFMQRAPHLSNNPYFTYISSDLRSAIFPDKKFDYIIHAAAPAAPRSLAQDMSDVVDIIVKGTQRILEWANHQQGARFLLVSSGAVYSTVETTFRHAYAIAKKTAEIACLQCEAITPLIARPFTFIGPYQTLDAGFAITDFIHDGLQKQIITVQNGSAIRSYAYGADLARWLLTILLEGKPSKPYDIGSENPISMLELAQRVQMHLQLQGVTTTLKVGTPIDVPPYLPDTRQAYQDLGLKLNFSLDEAIARTIQWFRIKQ